MSQFSVNNEAAYSRSEAESLCYKAGITAAAVPFIRRMLAAEALVRNLAARIEALESTQRNSVPAHSDVERRTA